MNTHGTYPVVVVTGASGGIGRASAIEFARKGARLALIARGEAGLKAAAADVEALGRKALAVQADVSKPEEIESAIQDIETNLGEIDIWVNVAFTSVFAGFTTIAPEEFKRVTEVTYLGYVYSIMAILPRMRQRGRGTIVNVGSALAYRGIPLQSAYSGAKHAIQGFNESLRVELLHERSPVNITMAQMPAVNTPQFSWVLSRLPNQAQPVPPIYQPEVAAKAVVYAANHPKRREHWVGGSTVKTLLANAIAPGILDRYLARTGFSAQQTSTPRDPDQAVNLWEPADEDQDFGPRGIFSDVARVRSTQRWLSRHFKAITAGGVVALSGAAIFWWRRIGDQLLGASKLCTSRGKTGRQNI